MKKNNIKKVALYFTVICIMLFIGFDNVFAASTSTTEYVKCGNSTFPAPLATIIRTLILLLQIIVPVGIIIMGSLDFLKATIAGDSDKMKKNQKQFLSRLVAGAIVFFVFVIIKFVVSLVADQGNSESVSSCLDCLINNEGSCNVVADSPFEPEVQPSQN